MAGKDYIFDKFLRAFPEHGYPNGLETMRLEHSILNTHLDINNNEVPCDVTCCNPRHMSVWLNKGIKVKVISSLKKSRQQINSK